MGKGLIKILIAGAAAASAALYCKKVYDNTPFVLKMSLITDGESEQEADAAIRYERMMHTIALSTITSNIDIVDFYTTSQEVYDGHVRAISKFFINVYGQDLGRVLSYIRDYEPDLSIEHISLS